MENQNKCFIPNRICRLKNAHAKKRTKNNRKGKKRQQWNEIPERERERDVHKVII